MDIGQTIKMIRNSMGQSQEGFAKGLRVTQTTISNLENNTTTIPPATLKKISTYTKVPVPLILIWSITEEDVPDGQLEKFKDLWPTITDLAEKVFKK